MGTLFYDRSARLALVPPNFALDLGVRADVASYGHHDWFSGRLDDVFHMLDDLEVSEHIADRGNDTLLLEVVSKVQGVDDRCGRDGLLDEEGGFGKLLKDLDLQVCSWSVRKALS